MLLLKILKKLQDKIIILYIDFSNKEYKLYNTITEKRKGRNKCLLALQMDN